MFSLNKFSVIQNRKLFFFFSIVILLFLLIRGVYHHNDIPVEIPSIVPGNNVLDDHVAVEDEDYINNIREFQVTIKKGDRLIDILKTYRISKDDSYRLLSSLKGKYNVNKIREGQIINLTIEEDKNIHLISFEIDLDRFHKVLSTHNDKGEFDSRIIEVKKFKQIVKVSQPIKGSLFTTAISNGISEQLIMNLAYLYSNNINLNRDISDGNRFEVMFEQFVDSKGKISHYGNVIYASLTTNKSKKESCDIYRYTTKNGNESYFYGNGNYVTNSDFILGLPLEKIKISSPFGKRFHPVLKKKREHKGVDLVASVGTPVKSTGNGIVEYIGRRGGYGNYIKIKHDKHYSTAYAHLSEFKKGLKAGSIVKSGEVIAYSGSTGVVTGPHLHYEVLYKNKQVDPINHRVSHHHLEGEELLEFKKFIAKIQSLLKLEEIPGDAL
ncbi:MAG: M23 family metallopeptidase [Rickettsiaceae bacterium H1]|nr:M23 family metallopeptidase [Rickettsiaceae bacterium H1]